MNGTETIDSDAPRRLEGPGRLRSFLATRLPVTFVAVVSLCISVVTPLAAEDDSGKPPMKGRDVRSQSETAITLTKHTIEIEGEPVAYQASAGTVDVAVEGRKAQGRMFFVAYTRVDGDAEKRPVAYVFNGGPGAASAYLHLLAIGPRIVALDDDGTIPDPPVRIIDNPFTWLPFTDLVFVDPIGTGYSTAVKSSGSDDAGGDASETADGRAEAPFWGTAQDLNALAEFIRLHLTRTGRWRSPKFLVGESYGGFRAAALPKRLASQPGVRLNGVVMISPVLEFSHLQFSPYQLLPWASLLPSYAATALHHGKHASSVEKDQLLADVESLAMDDYLSWLAQGDSLEDKSVGERVARFIGLSPDLVSRYRGRIPRDVFAKALLRRSHRLISLYDGTVTGIDPHPEEADMVAEDPVLAALTAPLTAALSSYVRDELEYENDRAYLVLNRKVSRSWDWPIEREARRGAIGTADSLKEAMSLNNALKVFIAHGLYDLITPYLATKFTVEQMALDSAIRPNLVLKTYEGGHMLYTHAAARAALYRDARDFFKRATDGGD